MMDDKPCARPGCGHLRSGHRSPGGSCMLMICTCYAFRHKQRPGKAAAPVGTICGWESPESEGTCRKWSRLGTHVCMLVHAPGNKGEHRCACGAWWTDRKAEVS